MCFLFKLSKHRLAVHRTLEAFQILVQQSKSSGWLMAVLQQLFNQQIFIHCRSNLCHKQTVAGILSWLMVLGQPCMLRMAHLMGKCRNGIQRSGEVQQNERIGIIGAGRIGTAGFPNIWIHINPAVFIRCPDPVDIVFAKRCHRIQHHLLCLLIGIACMITGRQRCIDIIVMQLIQAENLLAQCDIAVHRIHVVMHSLNQIVIDRYRNVIGSHGCLTGTFIAAQLCLGSGSFYAACIGRGKCMNMLAVGIVIGHKAVFTKGAVCAHLQRNV